MTLPEAIDFIRPAVPPTSGTWADVGAGTGLFTAALMQILVSGKIIALDKSPHGLFHSKIQNRHSKIKLEIMEADFHDPLPLPPLDGILMANALHYAKDHVQVLTNVLHSLKSGGTFLLIEYDTETANTPWVPNPVSFRHFEKLCRDAGLDQPALLNKRPSIYQDGALYLAATHKLV